ncbi:MAG: hypothetical protein AB7G13_02205 [Lautropia sp.]
MDLRQFRMLLVAVERAGDSSARSSTIVPARIRGSSAEGDRHALFLVEKSGKGVAVDSYAAQDGAEAADLAFSEAPAHLLVDSNRGADVLERAIDVGIAAACAEAVGAMDALFELTTTHLKTRQQLVNGGPSSRWQLTGRRGRPVRPAGGRHDLKAGAAVPYPSHSGDPITLTIAVVATVE